MRRISRQWAGGKVHGLDIGYTPAKLKNSPDTHYTLGNSLFFSYSILKELQENLPDSVRQAIEAKNNREI